MEFYEPVLLDHFVGRKGFQRFCDAVEMAVRRVDCNIRQHGYWRVPQRLWCEAPVWFPAPMGGGWVMAVRTFVEGERDTPE